MKTFRKFRATWSLVRLARKAQCRYRTNFLASFTRARHLCRDARFEPEEAYRLGLLDPALDTTDLSRYVSRKKLTKLQRALNPVAWEPLLKNKGIFHRYCVAHGIAVPKLFALFFRATPGWVCTGLSPVTRKEWVDVLQSGLPDRFIIKPAEGSLGRGVRAFSRQGDDFRSSDGKVCSASGLYDSMQTDTGFDSFVIEETLSNHPDIDAFTGNPCLQTLRIVTVCDAGNCCRTISAQLKMINGLSVTDNFANGMSGNISSSVDLVRGVLNPAHAARPDASGMYSLTEHPLTGRVFSDFTLPFWEDACALVETAARHFLPIRTIGWDVALTPEGPVIIEGNFWWNPFNQHSNMGSVAEILKQQITG
jgi:hypothetical protein